MDLDSGANTPDIDWLIDWLIKSKLHSFSAVVYARVNLWALSTLFWVFFLKKNILMMKQTVNVLCFWIFYSVSLHWSRKTMPRWKNKIQKENKRIRQWRGRKNAPSPPQAYHSPQSMQSVHDAMLHADPCNICIVLLYCCTFVLCFPAHFPHLGFRLQFAARRLYLQQLKHYLIWNCGSPNKPMWWSIYKISCQRDRQHSVTAPKLHGSLISTINLIISAIKISPSRQNYMEKLYILYLSNLYSFNIIIISILIFIFQILFIIFISNLNIFFN